MERNVIMNYNYNRKQLKKKSEEVGMTPVKLVFT